MATSFDPKEFISLKDIHKADINNSCGMFPKYFSSYKRAKTFVGWELDHLSAKDMCFAGFIFTGKRDKVQCFACGGILYNWIDNGNTPLQEHIRWFPQCTFARLQHSNKIKDFFDLPCVMAVKDLGYSDKIIRQAYRDVVKEGIVVPNAGQLFDKIHASQYEQVFDDSDEADLNDTLPRTVVEASGPMPIDISAEYQKLRQMDEVVEENRKLKEKKKCRLCPNSANTVFLPCGHLALCLECTKKRGNCIKCMICRTRIVGMVNVYII